MTMGCRRAWRRTFEDQILDAPSLLRAVIYITVTKRILLVAPLVHPVHLLDYPQRQCNRPQTLPRRNRRCSQSTSRHIGTPEISMKSNSSR